MYMKVKYTYWLYVRVPAKYNLVTKTNVNCILIQITSNA